MKKIILLAGLCVGLSACGGSSSSDTVAVYEVFSLDQQQDLKVVDSADLSGTWILTQTTRLTPNRDASEHFNGTTKVKFAIGIKQDGDQVSIQGCGPDAYRGSYSLDPQGGFSLDLRPFLGSSESYSSPVSISANNVMTAKAEHASEEYYLAFDMQALKVSTQDELENYRMPNSRLQVNQLVRSDAQVLGAAAEYQVICAYKAHSTLEYSDTRSNVIIKQNLDSIRLFTSTADERQLELLLLHISESEQVGENAPETGSQARFYVQDQDIGARLNIETERDFDGVEIDASQLPYRLQVRNNNNPENAIIDLDVSLHL